MADTQAARPYKVHLQDPDTAERIRALIADKLVMAERCGAVVQRMRRGAHEGPEWNVLVGDIDRGASLTSAVGLDCIDTFANDAEPGYSLIAEGSRVILAGRLLPERVAALLQELSGYPLIPGQLVPYGFVDTDGVISSIFWMCDLDFGPSDETSMCRFLSSDCYVLEGRVLPPVLFLSPGPGGGREWIECFWQMVDERQVVRLSDRLNNLQKEAWAVVDGSRSWLEIEDSSGTTPAFGDGRYNFWHITERKEGERFRNLRKGMVRRNPLRGFFN